MKSKGMNTSSLFFAAHSSISSGPTLQNYLRKNKLAIGQILMGGFLQKKYRNATHSIPPAVHCIKIQEASHISE